VVDRSFIAMTRETSTDLSGGDERYYCREWATTHATTRALAGVAVLTVVVVNMLLARVLDALVGIEKHQTQSSRVVSRVIKVFLAQFCNTAVLMVALNANIDYFLNHKSETSSVSSSDGDSYSVYALESLLKLRVTAREVFRGKYSDFSTGWYTDVGVALVLTALANAVSPHAWAVGRYVAMRVSQIRDRGFRHWRDASRSSRATQRDLEALYRGRPFDLSSRYSQALTSIFIAYLVRSIVALGSSFQCWS
jgi:hypothetical protein